MPICRDENCGKKQAGCCPTNHHQTNALTECMSICADCAKKCMEEGHKKVATLCVECADACALAIKSASSQLLGLCAEICKQCADECQTLPLQHCEECAQCCRQCAKVCSSD